MKRCRHSARSKSQLKENSPPGDVTQVVGRIKDSQEKMGVPFDFAPERPEHIDAILNGLDRYNPETTQVFQDYVTEQCESKTYDCYANLALLKL
jgi:hypothetical protein